MELLTQLSSQAAEEATVGALILDQDAVAYVQELDLQPADFYFSKAAAVYEAVIALHEAHEAVNIISVGERLNGAVPDGMAYIAHLVNAVPSSTYAYSYGTIVKRYAILRNMVQFGAQITKRAADAPDPDELFAWASEQMQQFQPRHTDTGAMLWGEDTILAYGEMLERRIEEAHAGTLQRFAWPSPWHSWRKNIRPPRPGQVATIAAPDGVGKSMYLECIAEQWAINGNNVVLVHFEDDHQYKLDRRMARHSGIPLEMLEDATLDTDAWRRKAEAEAKLAPWTGRLHYLHTAGWSMAQVLRELRTYADAGKCDAVVLDYLDKAQADHRQVKLFGQNVWGRQGDDMEQFKSFCEQAGVPGVTATQGNKGMQESGTRTRRDIEGSGQKSQRSQLVVIITREIVDDIGEAKRLGVDPGGYSPIATVRVDKQNRGRTMSFQQRIDGPRFMVYDLQRELS